jgi:hypothetical protein
MVNPALKREFERNGIRLIPIETGVRCMLHEMMADKSEPAEVVIGGGVIDAHASGSKELRRPALVKTSPIVKKQQLSHAFELQIDIQNFPILQSHIIDGKPVVPLALMTEWFAHGALHANPGLVLAGVDDVRVLKGIRLDNERRQIRLLTGKVKKSGAFYEMEIELRSDRGNGQDSIHSRARAILSDCLPPSPEYRFSKAMVAKAYTRNMEDVYDKILFHGTKLHGIRKIVSCSSRGMAAHISPAPEPKKWISEPLRNRWIADPLVLDSSFQMATIWCFEERGIVSLPSYISSYRQYRPQFPSDGVTVILAVTDSTNRKMKGDITFLDTADEIVARLTGYEAIMDPSLHKAFKPQYRASA